MAKKGRKKGRRAPRFKVRTIRRDRFGRFNPKGRTVQRIRIAILPKRAREEAEPEKPPRGAVSLADRLHPDGRFAFLARDQRPDLADFFKPDTQVTALLKFGYTDPKTGKAYDVERLIHWDSGENEEEFWDNYYDEVRDELDTFSSDHDRYSQFGIAVSYMM